MKFTGTLKSHQKNSVELFTNKRRVIFGDPVGQGKTISAVAAVCEEDISPILVIAEKSTIYQWKSAIKKFIGMDSIIVNSDKDFKEDFEWYIVVYEQLYSRKFNNKFKVVILDEVTKLKNENKLYRKIKKITKDVQYVIGATATPVENRLTDFYNIFNIVNPIVFGRYNKYHFRNKFIVGHWEDIWNNYLKKKVPVFKATGYKCIEEFKQIVSEYYLTSSALNIKRNNFVKYVDMTTEQRQKYLDVFHRSGGKMGLENIIEFEMIVSGVYEDKEYIKKGKKKIKQVNSVTIFEDSPKFQLVRRALKNYKKGIVVFSKYKLPLEYLSDSLGDSFEYIHGDLGLEERADLQDRFNDHQLPILGLTCAGEKGLNLNGGELFIFLNQLWNPARNEQLIGRITRLDSKVDEIDVVKAVCTGSIDAWVEGLLKKKLELFKEFVPEEADYERMIFNEVSR